jgi:ribonuclease BN (tRNA processing enzyme)
MQVPSRRSFVTGPLALASAQLFPANVRAAASTRLILLGVGGGPRPRTTNSAPAQVIVINGSLYVVDCGDGVARQLVMAGLSLDRLRHVFITHHHSDHNADYGNLLLLSWVSGLRTRVDAWGPPPLQRMTRLFFSMNAYDLRTRVADEGRPALPPLVHAHELRRGGLVMQDENVRVTSALVHHPPVTPAFAYRFDTPDRSIVISGDTAATDTLVELARGADVLVHECYLPAAVERLVARVPNAARLRESILSHHTSAEDVGRLADAAGVNTLVLSHLVPADDPDVTEQMWIAAARTHFRGRVVLGRDLLEL